MEKDLKQMILSCGADVCGIANIDRFANTPEGFSPKDIYDGCRSVLVFGVALPKGLTKVDSRLIYGHFNNFLCHQVDEIAIRGAKILENDYSAVAIPMPCDSPYEFWEEENMIGRGLISMKHAAALSGIGEIGKNSLLINPQYGNLLTIGAILTNLDLKSDERCKTLCISGCTKCIDACPVHAIEPETVNQKLCRLNTYGKTSRGFDTVECNRCRVVCPMRYGIGAI